MKKMTILLMIFLVCIVLFIGCSPSSNSDQWEISERYISLKTQNNGVLIRVTRDGTWSDNYATYLNFYDIDNNNSDSINQHLCLHYNAYSWENNKATFFYPFVENGKRYRIRLRHYSYSGQQLDEYVNFTAAGGVGENPKFALLKQIQFEPAYDSSSKRFSVNLNSTDSILSELVRSLEINDNVFLNNVSLMIQIYQRQYQGSGSKLYGELYFSSSGVPRARSYEIPKDDGFDDVQNTPDLDKCFLDIRLTMDLITKGISVQNQLSTHIEGHEFSTR